MVPKFLTLFSAELITQIKTKAYVKKFINRLSDLRYAQIVCQRKKPEEWLAEKLWSQKQNLNSFGV